MCIEQICCEEQLAHLRFRIDWLCDDLRRPQCSAHRAWQMVDLLAAEADYAPTWAWYWRTDAVMWADSLARQEEEDRMCGTRYRECWEPSIEFSERVVG